VLISIPLSHNLDMGGIPFEMLFYSLEGGGISHTTEWGKDRRSGIDQNNKENWVH